MKFDDNRVLSGALGRSHWRNTKSATPNAKQNIPTITYKKDIEKSKPRYNPDALNSKPTKTQTNGTLS